jgi:hypothetical protein
VRTTTRRVLAPVEKAEAVTTMANSTKRDRMVTVRGCLVSGCAVTIRLGSLWVPMVAGRALCVRDREGQYRENCAVCLNDVTQSENQKTYQYPQRNY